MTAQASRSAQRLLFRMDSPGFVFFCGDGPVGMDGLNLFFHDDFLLFAGFTSGFQESGLFPGHTRMQGCGEPCFLFFMFVCCVVTREFVFLNRTVRENNMNFNDLAARRYSVRKSGTFNIVILPLSGEQGIGWGDGARDRNRPPVSP